MVSHSKNEVHHREGDRSDQNEQHDRTDDSAEEIIVDVLKEQIEDEVEVAVLVLLEDEVGNLGAGFLTAGRLSPWAEADANADELDG